MGAGDSGRRANRYLLVVVAVVVLYKITFGHNEMGAEKNVTQP